MEIFDKEEIELIKKYRADKQEQGVLKERRLVAWDLMSKGITDFIKSNGTIVVADCYDGYLSIDDWSLQEDAKTIILYVEG